MLPYDLYVGGGERKSLLTYAWTIMLLSQGEARRRRHVPVAGQGMMQGGECGVVRARGSWLDGGQREGIHG